MHFVENLFEQDCQLLAPVFRTDELNLRSVSAVFVDAVVEGDLRDHSGARTHAVRRHQSLFVQHSVDDTALARARVADHSDDCPIPLSELTHFINLFEPLASIWILPHGLQGLFNIVEHIGSLLDSCLQFFGRCFQEQLSQG